MNQLLEFRKVDLAVPVPVGRPDHGPDLGPGQGLPQARHRLLQLARGDQTVTIAIKNSVNVDIITDRFMESLKRFDIPNLSRPEGMTSHIFFNVGVTLYHHLKEFIEVDLAARASRYVPDQTSTSRKPLILPSSFQVRLKKES